MLSSEADKEAATQIGAGYLGQAPDAVIPIVGKGRINHIFIVRAAGAQEIVVRLNGLFAAPAALAEYHKERWCLERTGAAGVPGPAVLGIGEQDDRAYMIQTRVPGDNAEDSPAARTAVWRALGEYAARIHAIDITRDAPPDSLFSLLSCATTEDWLRQIEEGIAALSAADILRERGVYAPEQRETITGLFSALKFVPFRPGLSHGDLTLKNATVDPEGEVYLLDWGTALVQAVPAYDLSQILKNHIQTGAPDRAQIDAFLEGYGISAPDAEPTIGAATAYLLLRAFGKARWAIGRGHPDAVAFTGVAREALRFRLSESAGEVAAASGGSL